MENHSFEYTYSASRQKEIEAIRQKYLPPKEDKLELLRQLHSVPTRKAQSASIALGVLGALTLGTGMSLCMTDLGSRLGNYAMVAGVIIGLCGIAQIIFAYPFYRRTLKKERDRIAPEILKLTEELLK